jgi:hypothetical protein
MYSIFSAEAPVTEYWLELLPAYAYEKTKTYQFFPDSAGTNEYKSQSDNIFTCRNDELLARLFGKNNTIYV